MNSFFYFLKNLKSALMATTWGLEELAEMKKQQDLDTPIKDHSTCLECTGKGPAAVWKRVRVLPLSKGKSKGTAE